MRISVLIAEDDPSTLELTKELVLAWKPAGEVYVVAAGSPEAALAAAKEYSFSIALLDLHYRGSQVDGYGLLRELRTFDGGMELLVLSSAATFSAVQQALRAGANDYLAKGFGRGELYHVLDRALERARWRKLELRVKTQGKQPVLAMGGKSKAVSILLSAMKKFGPSGAPVLIFGETGTGKELAAKGLHAHGTDPTASFVAVNCAAVPASTVDSFFFGHERGSFTGADRAREGVFEEANGGTLFLDEVNSLPLDIQGRLLRVLEEKMVRRLGGSKVIPVEFRLLAATNGDLEAMVQSGSFREDLYYRLNTLQMRIPPLRDRIEDLEELAQLFQPKRSFSPDLWRLWRSYSWPGNIREFRNLLLAMDALADPSEVLGVEHIPEHLLRKFSGEYKEDSSGGAGATEQSDLTDFSAAQEQRELEFLRRAYRSAGGNISRMARVMGADRSHLHQKLVKLGIHASKR